MLAAVATALGAVEVGAAAVGEVEAVGRAKVGDVVADVLAARPSKLAARPSKLAARPSKLGRQDNEAMMSLVIMVAVENIIVVWAAWKMFTWLRAASSPDAAGNEPDAAGNSPDAAGNEPDAAGNAPGAADNAGRQRPRRRRKRPRRRRKRRRPAWMTFSGWPQAGGASCTRTKLVTIYGRARRSRATCCARTAKNERRHRKIK